MSRDASRSDDRIEHADTTHRIAHSEAPFRVEHAPVEVVLVPVTPAADAASRKAAAHTDARLLLQLGDVERPGQSGSFDVYVNVPAGALPQDHPDHFAGRISLYGPPATPSTEGRSAPRAFNFVLDITEVHRRLTSAASPSGEVGDPVRISVVPVHAWSGPVTIGSVTLNLG